MRYLLMLTAIFIVIASYAEARSNRSNYQLYGYGGNTSYSNANGNYASRGSSRYSSYGYGNGGRGSFNGSSRRVSNSRYWRAGGTSHYNDPTGYRFVKINRQKNIAMPSGNYGRAANRTRASY